MRSLPDKRNIELVKFIQNFLERSSLLRSLCIEGCPPFKEGDPLKLTSLILHHLLRGFFLKEIFLTNFKIKNVMPRLKEFFVLLLGGV